VKEGSSTVDDCEDCPPGYFCPASPGAQAKTVLCPAGKYCMGGNAEGKNCPPGFYCPLGSSTPKPCDAGKYCNETGLIEPKGDCDAGYICEYEKIV
jgi:hypothetical protein